MSKKILSFFHRDSISLQTVVRIGVAILVAFGLFLTILIQTVIQDINAKNHQKYLERIVKYSTELAQDVEGIKTSMSVLATNPTIQENVYLQGVSQQGTLDISKVLTPIVDSANFYLLKNITVYSHFFYTHFPGDGRYFHNREKLQTKDWLFQVPEGSVLSTYRSSPLNKKPQVVFVNTVPDRDNSQQKQNAVYQEVVVDLASFFIEYYNYGFEGVDIFAFHKQSHDTFYSTNPEKKAAVRKFYSQLGDHTPDQRTIDQAAAQIDGIPIIYSIDGLNLALVFVYPKADIKTVFSDINTQIYLLAAAMVFLLLLVFIYYFKLHVSHLNRIIHRINSFNERGVEPIVIPARTTELGNLEYYLAINQQRIRSLIQKEYMMQVQHVHAQQQTLLAYINPHFLYNTLNSISAMANIEGAPKTVEMLFALSNIFRYSTDTKEVLVPLSNEIDIIQEFLLLQQIRYGAEFTYAIALSPDYLHYKIPKFSLQPLVENSFKHGFKGVLTKKHIQISSLLQGSDFYLKIRDNGLGIAPEIVEAINLEFAKNSFSDELSPHIGLGLSNVNTRIKLLYGADYRLHIESELAHFTEITLHISIDDALTNLPNESIYL